MCGEHIQNNKKQKINSSRSKQCIVFFFIQKKEVELYAQAGGTVIVPRNTNKGTFEDSSDDSTKLYVNWYRGSEEAPFISRNPNGVIQGGETDV